MYRSGVALVMQKCDTCKRYDSLDFLKFLCAFLVITIHMPYVGKEYIEPLTRFSVPVFFMITGYFYSSTKKNNREYTQIKKTFGLMLSSNLLFLGWEVMKSVILREPISNGLSSMFSIEVWLNFLFFNVSPFSEHLWYLGALFYILAIILAVDKYSSRKKLYKFIPLLLLINVVFGNYSTIVFGTVLPRILTRNFLFCGLPFFLIGDAIKERQNRLTHKQLVITAILAIIITLVESMFLHNTAAEFNEDCFIATPFLAYSLFVLFLDDTMVSNTHILRKIAQLGKSATTIIYVIHPIAITVVGKIVDILSGYIPFLSKVYLFAAPLIILFLCTLFAVLFNKIKKKVP